MAVYQPPDGGLFHDLRDQTSVFPEHSPEALTLNGIWRSGLWEGMSFR